MLAGRANQTSALSSCSPSLHSVPKLFRFNLVLNLFLGFVDGEDIVEARNTHDIFHNSTSDKTTDTQFVYTLERVETTSSLHTLQIHKPQQMRVEGRRNRNTKTYTNT
eukprot:GHVS01103260.1.p1 GENE.GHVS01103260.1~~GHVS01103260.1.p1  ORF type:complete len:108 (-),score=8.60 GHVS01103260.1:4-327(-)